LLMVQGWRRYSWEQMAGVEPFELKYLAEQGIETHGNIVSLTFFGGKQIPKPNVDVTLWLQKRTENDDTSGSFIETFVTDDQGRFSFVSDAEGRWNMILAVRENGKPKNYMILLDRVFNPEPKRYRYADLQVNISEQNSETIDDEEMPDDDSLKDDFASFLVAYNDSLAKLGISGQVNQLSEVKITAKRRTKEQEIYQNKSTSIAYYDVASEFDDLYDSGKYIGDNIHELMMNMNNDFDTRHFGSDEFLYYKGKMMLFVVNYGSVEWSRLGYFHYKDTRVSAIKSIYINENTSVIAYYIKQPNPRGPSPMEIAMHLSCVVFIETYPEGEIPVEGAKGVRKTWLEGYSAVSEFYSPNYSELPPTPDYRRTLYWNPMVTTDEDGRAKIQFYNNSSCRNFSISAETVTPSGIIGIYKRE